jgi:hypothetical protein
MLTSLPRSNAALTAALTKLATAEVVRSTIYNLQLTVISVQVLDNADGSTVHCTAGLVFDHNTHQLCPALTIALSPSVSRDGQARERRQTSNRHHLRHPR